MTPGRNGSLETPIATCKRSLCCGNGLVGWVGQCGSVGGFDDAGAVALANVWPWERVRQGEEAGVAEEIGCGRQRLAAQRHVGAATAACWRSMAAGSRDFRCGSKGRHGFAAGGLCSPPRIGMHGMRWGQVIIYCIFITLSLACRHRKPRCSSSSKNSPGGQYQVACGRSLQTHDS